MDDHWSRYESVVDEQIRKAQERGDFDNLPGKGKPLPGLDGPDDEDWWLKSFIRREGLSADALLPTPLRLRKEIEQLPETLRDVPTEAAARAIVSDLNRRIVLWLRAPSDPPIRLGPVQADLVIREWRERHGRYPPPDFSDALAPVAKSTEVPVRHTSLWRRIVGARQNGRD